MSNQQVSQKNSAMQTKKPQKKKQSQVLAFQFERLFKWLALLVFLMTIFGYYHIQRFREHCLRINNYTADIQNVALWVAIGFIFNFIAKKLFQIFFSSFIRKNLAKVFFLSRSEQQLDEKALLQTRQLYDTFFHFGISFVSWYCFYHEEWYPSIIGGYGTCPAILAKAFYWPSPSTTQAFEALYGFQIGSILRHFFQLTVTHREIYIKRNYYELLFHHFITVGMETIALFYNMVDAGMIMVILHDFSDGLRGINKVIKDSNLSETHGKLVKWLDYTYIFVWTMTRIFVFPLCAFQALLDLSWPVIQDMSYLFYQVNYLIVMSVLIISLQVYWLYFLLKYRLIDNTFEKHKQRIEEKKQKKDKKDS